MLKKRFFRSMQDVSPFASGLCCGSLVIGECGQLLHDLHLTVWPSTSSPEDHFSTSVSSFIRYQWERWGSDQRRLHGVWLAGLG